MVINIKAYLIVFIFFTSLVASSLSKASDSDVKLLQAVNLGATPKIRKSVMMISRLGVIDVVPGIAIDEKGHILASRIVPIDSNPSPYLLVQPDGSRSVLEIVSEIENRNLVLLRSSTKLADAKVVTLGSEDSETGYWYILPTFPALPLVDEPVILKWQALKEAEDEDQQEYQSRTEAFDLDVGVLLPGQLVLDVDGRLAGVVSRSEEDSSRVIKVFRLIQEWREFADVVSKPTNAKSIKLPSLVLSDNVALPELVPYGVVSNVEQSPTNSILGIVIDKRGLVVTKASELGGSLTFSINGKTLPATLVATDEVTDLALLSVEGGSLPTIEFTTGQLKPGQFLFTPRLVRLGIDDDSVIVGSYSHQRDFSVPNVHESSMVTSMGIVPEQALNKLIVSAILPDSPAEQAGVKLGDEFLLVDGQKVFGRAGLARLLAERKSGEAIRLKIKRQVVQWVLPDEVILDADFFGEGMTYDRGSMDSKSLEYIGGKPMDLDGAGDFKTAKLQFKSMPSSTFTVMYFGSPDEAEANFMQSREDAIAKGFHKVEPMVDSEFGKLYTASIYGERHTCSMVVKNVHFVFNDAGGLRTKQWILGKMNAYAKHLDSKSKEKVKDGQQHVIVETTVNLAPKFPKPPLTGVRIRQNYVPMIPSVRRSPFPEAIVHDLDLNAWECGGPLYDIEGRAVGINIATTGQFWSLALPPEVINQAIERMKKNVISF